MGILLNAGADATAKNKHGWTATDFFETCQKVKLGKENAECKNEVGQLKGKASLLERLKCYKLTKRQTKNSSFKVVSTTYGNFLCLHNQPKEYATSVPVINPQELLRDSFNVTVNGESLYMRLESKKWRGTPVYVRRVDVENTTHAHMGGHLKTLFANSIVRELNVVSHLQHPNILSLLAVVLPDSMTSLDFLDPTAISLVYERPCLGSLHYFTQVKLEEIPALSAITICRQIAEALMFLHSFGIIHCNVTPHAIQLFAVDIAKLGNFEYAVQSSELKSWDRWEPPTEPLTPISSNRSEITDSTVSTKTDEHIPHMTLYECALHLPASHLANWLPPELFPMGTPQSGQSQGRTNLRGPLSIQKPTFTSDVYSLAKVLQSLIPNLAKDSPDRSLEYAGYKTPITNARMVLNAALQPRPEERLPLKQFHRLLIHLFWTEYDQLKSPKPQLTTTLPCPLRLCDHRTPGRHFRQQTSPKSSYSTETTTTARTKDSTSITIENALDSSLSCSQHNITFRRRRRSKTGVTQQPPHRTLIGETSMKTPSHSAATYPIRHPSPDSPWKCGNLLTSDTSPSSEFYKSGVKRCPVKSSSPSEPEWSSLSDRRDKDFSTCKAVLNMENVTSQTTSSPGNTSQTADQKTKSKQHSVKLARFYPIVNEWLKQRKRVNSKTDDSVNRISPVTCQPSSAPSPSKTVRSPSLSKLPLISCLKSPQTMFRRSKSVKLSRTDYLQLAAVPLVPEGVEVPPDLVPWRSPSVCQHSENRLSRSNTMPPRRMGQTGSPLVTPIALSSQKKLPHSDFKTLDIRDKRDITPVKPASHHTYLTPVAVDYSEVTGKPDLIRSSSRLGRRSRRSTDRRHPRTDLSMRSPERTLEQTTQNLRRNRSCSSLHDRRNPNVTIKNVSTQTEHSVLHRIPVVSTPHECTSEIVLQSAPSKPVHFANTSLLATAGGLTLKAESDSLKTGLLTMRQKFLSTNISEHTPSNQLTRVGKMVEMFECRLSPKQTTPTGSATPLKRMYNPQLELKTGLVDASRCVTEPIHSSGHVDAGRAEHNISPTKPVHPSHSEEPTVVQQPRPVPWISSPTKQAAKHHSKGLRRSRSQPLSARQHNKQTTLACQAGSCPILYWTPSGLAPDCHHLPANPDHPLKFVLPTKQTAKQEQAPASPTMESVDKLMKTEETEGTISESFEITLDGDLNRNQPEPGYPNNLKDESLRTSTTTLDTLSSKDFELPPPQFQPVQPGIPNGEVAKGSMDSLPPPPPSTPLTRSDRTVPGEFALKPPFKNDDDDYVDFLTIPLTGYSIQNGQRRWILSPTASDRSTAKHKAIPNHSVISERLSTHHTQNPVEHSKSDDDISLNSAGVEDKENTVPPPDVLPTEPSPLGRRSMGSRANSQSSYIHWDLL